MKGFLKETKKKAIIQNDEPALIPLAHCDVGAYASDDCEQKIQEKSKKRILVVEDDSSIQKLLETLLTSNGYSVNAFHDGYDAVQCFLELRHDLVLTDIDMPGISGIILADYIKSQDDEIPVIAVTGKKIVAEGLFDEVIGKPFDPSVLLKMINSYCMSDSLCDEVQNDSNRPGVETRLKSMG